MMSIDVIDDIEDIGDLHAEWDDLAVSLGRPFCSPAWMTSWWRRAAPDDAHLRVIVARQGRELLGIAPFFARAESGGIVRYRLLAAPISARTQPLARPGAEDVVAGATVSSLARAHPPPAVLAFDGISNDSSWPQLLRHGWPGSGRGWQRQEPPMAAPTITLDGKSFEQWLKERSANFRSQMRRKRRRLEAAGAVFKLATTDEELTAGLDSFAAMHYDRWRWRGGSGVLTPAIERMLADVARTLVGDLRFRLWTIHVDEKCISAQIFIGAGGELSYWLGGFDEAWAAHGPSNAAILEAVQHAWTVGDRRIDLGAGGQRYKYSFADGQDDLEWVTIVPPGRRHALTRLQLMPTQLNRWTRSTLSRRMSQTTKDRIKRMLKRIHS
jgi:CelD/BcsL family acetyltransferase involved in cellulose biosynthesis